MEGVSLTGVFAGQEDPAELEELSQVQPESMQEMRGQFEAWAPREYVPHDHERLLWHAPC